MKLSQVNIDALRDLSREAITSIVFEELPRELPPVEIAVVLGGRPERIGARIEAAGRLWLEGKVKWLVPSGGVVWEWEEEKLSEAAFIKKNLLKMGVSEEAILLEEEARTTRENMICSLLTIHRKFNLATVRDVVIVSSPSHMRRSLLLANWIFPKSVRVHGCASTEPSLCPDTWFTDPQSVGRVEHELRLLRKMMDEKIFGEIEFSSDGY